MFKKWLSVVLALAMLAAMPAFAAAETTPVQIEFWFGLGGNLGDIVLNAIDEFNASQSETVVIGVQQASYGATENAVHAAMAAGDVPACFLAGSGLYSQRDSGIFEILDEYIAADEAMDINDYLESALLTDRDSQGRIIGLPLFATTQISYYRVDAFEKAGIDPDWAFANWQNLAQAAAKMTVVENGQTVFYGYEPMYGAANMLDAIFAAGGSVYADDEWRTVNLLSDEWVEVLESFRKWIHEDKIMTIHFGGEGWAYWYKTIDDVMEGRAAGYTGSSGDQGDLDFTKLAAHIQPGWGENPCKPMTDGPSVFIPSMASAEQKAAAYKFLAYLTSADIQSKISMATGYVPVRKSCLENAEYAAHLEKNPQAKVPMDQLNYATPQFLDITGAGIGDAIGDAVDMVQIENIPAREALSIAQAAAQEALDEYWENRDN